MAIGLEELGLTKEEIQERLIDRMASKLLEEVSLDEDGDEYHGKTSLAQKLNGEIRKRIDEAVKSLADKHVLPKVESMIENITLQKTNQWGDKKGETLTFVEYLVERANAYMHEKVDYEGKSKVESRYSHFEPKQTRITHLVHSHLHYSIERAMKEALATANSKIVEGLGETIKIKLAEVQAALKIEVKTGR